MDPSGSKDGGLNRTSLKAPGHLGKNWLSVSCSSVHQRERVVVRTQIVAEGKDGRGQV